MALIKSISGIRGTIGGHPGDNLTPLDVVKFTAAYGTIIAGGNKTAKIVLDYIQSQEEFLKILSEHYEVW